MPIVLASGSATRRKLLEQAGIDFIVDKPDLDERPIKAACRNQGLDAEQTALALAVAKAKDVAGRHRGTVVVGADQMLDCEGEWFDKPIDLAAAKMQIARLSGKMHRLISAVVAVRDRETVWQAVDIAELTVRDLSAAAIDAYLVRVGDAALGSVGAYQVEGAGIRLFSAIHGDYFTIMGLPLLPLLQFLRDQGFLDE
jgi:septum formation protein